MFTDVSEERTAPNFRVDEQAEHWLSLNLMHVTQNVFPCQILIYKMLFVYQLIQISTLLLVDPDMKT
jgi:hypothetical protein